MLQIGELMGILRWLCILMHVNFSLLIGIVFSCVDENSIPDPAMRRGLVQDIELVGETDWQIGLMTLTILGQIHVSCPK